MGALREEQLDSVFAALSDRTRRAMLKMLSREQSLTVSAIANSFDMSKQAVSKHLAVLEEANLISKEKEGRLQLCKFEPETMDIVQKIVDQYREFWGQRLDALDEYIENKKKEK